MAIAGQEIVNPATGERIVFRRTSRDTGGELLELDDVWTRPGHRAPMHVHPGMEERWTVLAGTARFRIGDEEHTVTAGESIVAPPGVPHTGWNPTGEPVRLRVELRPALRWEWFTEELFAMFAEAVAGGRREPESAALAALVARYPDEIEPVSPFDAWG
ncbi:MAG TPA: cupin domain-containing protein [Capillimicrobium sp.]|nr:cupin domain-containing protein [Capillimicrobium sp.]